MKPLVRKRFAYSVSKGVDPVLNDSPTQLQAWIARMNDGDHAAKNELLRYAYERLRCLARKMLRQDFTRLKNWEETDDVLQNAALRLDRALGVVPVASAAEFFRLAATAIRRELMDLARHYQPGREAAAGSAPQLAESSSSPPAAADPSDSTYEPSRLEAWTEFHKQVEALPEEEREIIDLIWYEGLEQSEAASFLGVPRATVQRRWLKARLRLKAVLDHKHWGFLVAGKP
jgi:RNA polymerase sigma-70 factor (ECF subfamily)